MFSRLSETITRHWAIPPLHTTRFIFTLWLQKAPRFPLIFPSTYQRSMYTNIFDPFLWRRPPQSFFFSSSDRTLGPLECTLDTLSGPLCVLRVERYSVVQNSQRAIQAVMEGPVNANDCDMCSNLPACYGACPNFVHKENRGRHGYLKGSTFCGCLCHFEILRSRMWLEAWGVVQWSF